MPPKNLVIIPTYNEKENIENIIRSIFSLRTPFDVLVIDDGSMDGTADIIKELQQKFDTQLFLQQRPSKMGLGTAYIKGFKWALNQHYDYIFEMDADFSHNPQDLERLYATCHQDNYDMAIGSRYVKGGSVKNWNKKRIFISKLGSLYTRLLTLIPIKDTTAGFVCYKRLVLQTLNLDGIMLSGYGFQIEMKFRAYKAGFKIKEIPITFIDRVEGVSKMTSNIVREAIVGVIKLQYAYLTQHK